MSRAKHEVIEILSYVPEVIIDASERSVEDMRNFASVSSVSDSKLVIKNTKHLSRDEPERIIRVEGARLETITLPLSSKFYSSTNKAHRPLINKTAVSVLFMERK